MTSPLMFASLMLTDKITDNINNLLNKFKSIWDLGHIEIGISSDKIDVSEFDFSHVEEKQMMWEDVAKLSINIIVDYEYYSQFSFESRYTIKEYDDRLSKLGFAFKNNCWKSVRKPNIKDAHTNIFMYFLYRIIFDKMSFNQDIRQNNENERRILTLTEYGQTINELINVDCCQFGENENLPVNCTSGNEGRWNDVYNSGSRMCREENLSIVDFGVNKTVEGYDDWMKEEVNIKKWKCGGCGFLNNYSVVNCVVCYELYCKDGKWICDRCSVCNERNVNNNNTGGAGQTGAERVIDASNKSVLEVDNIEGKSDIAGRDKETHIPVDEWRCVCKTRQSYKYSVCDMCGRDRDVSGEWMCAKCKTINKCDIDRCSTCNEWNDNLPIKLCVYCKMNRVTGTEVRCEECLRKKILQWKCGYSKCGTMNKVNDEYCCKCYFWRCNTYGRGDECKRKGYFGINCGWICYKCEMVNDLSKDICAKDKCKETRYSKILCDNCKHYNDHILTKCRKCYKKLR